MKKTLIASLSLASAMTFAFPGDPQSIICSKNNNAQLTLHIQQSSELEQSRSQEATAYIAGKGVLKTQLSSHSLISLRNSKLTTLEINSEDSSEVIRATIGQTKSPDEKEEILRGYGELKINNKNISGLSCTIVLNNTIN